MRIAQGLMTAEQFMEFLSGDTLDAGISTSTAGGMILLALFGGLAMNLTPCVLPMIPINLLVIGKSARRGLMYGLGIALAYGLLGVAASIGGLAFGVIQGNPWFNLAVAGVFVVLGLALLDVFFIDFSRFRPNVGGSDNRFGLFPLFMGALSAVLAGACVAPVLIAVLLVTADMFARGNWAALSFPFVLGIGMALPWPFVGAGMQILPRPGNWMRWVNKLFALLVFGFAARYGYLSYRGFVRSSNTPDPRPAPITSSSVIRIDSPSQLKLDEYKRPVLIDCWATWCKNCAAMEKVLADPEVRKALDDWTVIKLQAEDINLLRSLQGFEEIRGLPAFVIIK